MNTPNENQKKIPRRRFTAAPNVRVNVLSVFNLAGECGEFLRRENVFRRFSVMCFLD